MSLVRTCLLCLSLFFFALTSQFLNAAQQPNKPDVFTDPAQAGPDFKVQGEYSGDKSGAQVVALGNGKFDVWFLAGGLPGDGWDTKTRKKASAQAADGKVTISGDYTGAIADGKL